MIIIIIIIIIIRIIIIILPHVIMKCLGSLSDSENDQGGGVTEFNICFKQLAAHKTIEEAPSQRSVD